MLKIEKMINARRKDIYFKNGNCFYAIANSDLIFNQKIELLDKNKKFRLNLAFYYTNFLPLFKMNE